MCSSTWLASTDIVGHRLAVSYSLMSDPVSDPRLQQIGGLVQRIASHPPHERFFRREVQDAPAGPSLSPPPSVIHRCSSRCLSREPQFRPSAHPSGPDGQR